MSNLINLANSFVKYFKSFNVKHIPENFVKEYYILSHGDYISLAEFVKWLGVNRKTVTENLKNNYKLNQDYFKVSINEELNCIKLYKKENYIFKRNQVFVKLTVKCFKDICIKSTTQKGTLVRKYYMELDDLFKKFHLSKIEDMSEENEILINNQKNNKKIIH